jgi:inward rectifier potassium channel
MASAHDARHCAAQRTDRRGADHEPDDPAKDNPAQADTLRRRPGPRAGPHARTGQSPWSRRFLRAIVVVLVLLINTVFAWVYTLIPGGVSNARRGSFEDAFFFSVQTLATIGYGTMAPQTRLAHIVVTIESILGIIAVGSLAGISFARLSRPKALVLFSSKVVVRDRNGVPHLQMRLANWRTNLIVEANLRVFLLVAEKTQEGEHNRTPLEVKLVRGSTPVFFLTWTVMHCIDPTSPFHGEDAIERLKASGAQLYVMLTGYDHTLGQVVHAYHEYQFSDIVHGARFVDIVGAAPDGTRTIDFARFHDIEPIGSTQN